MSSIFSSLGRDVSIDIGTMFTRAAVGGRNSMVEEPSMVATDTKQEEIVAVGEEAERIVRRMPDVWRPLTPLKDGFIVDYRVTHTMLKYFMHKASNSVRRSSVFLSAPCGMTDVEQRALMDAVIQGGAREVYLIETPVAAAIGSGMPVLEARGNMVVDIGGGTVDIGIMSLGGVVVSRTIRFGGDDLNDALLQYIRQCFSVMIAEQTVEDIKRNLGSALAPLDDEEYTFQGRDMTNGLIKRSVIHRSEVYKVLQEPLQRIMTEIKNVIRQTSPELVADIMQYGMVLTGGTALLAGLGERISSEIGVPVRIPNEPEHCVVQGLSEWARNLEQMERFVVASKHRKGRA